jgi:predicted thioesterase
MEVDSSLFLRLNRLFSQTYLSNIHLHLCGDIELSEARIAVIQKNSGVSSSWSMLGGTARQFTLKRWFKPTDVKLTDVFKVGARYSEDKLVTPALADSQPQVGHYVVSTSSMASTLHDLACSVVDDTIPSSCHALTRGTRLVHREPISIGNKMRLSLRIDKVDPNMVTFDVNVLEQQEGRVAATGTLEIGVIQTEAN